MSDATLTSYEQIPYVSDPVHGTHPDTLASMATLFGLNPPPFETGRILELGCGTGGNLITIADSLPQSRCIGIDLSPSHIAAGREVIRSLELNNVELRAGSILGIGDDWGRFDYIICHGVYSWVPPNIQDHILGICSRNLAPHGVAYVSYNVYPGWHFAGMIRDMVNFHGRRYPEPRERIAQARHFLDFLTGLVERDPDNSLYHGVLANQVEDLRSDRDAYLFHEYLEEVNLPVYFHEFAARATAKGLQFLSETHIAAMAGTLPNDVKEVLHGWSNGIVEYEQYIDFVRNRRFRKTLLCHAGEAVCHEPGPEVMRRFRFIGYAQPKSAVPDPSPTGTDQFQMPTGSTWSTNNPWMRAAARAAWAASPRSLSFAELAQQVNGALPDGVSPDESRLTQALFQAVLSGLMEFHLFEPAFVAALSERPIATPLARVQLRNGNRVTNRRHHSVEMDALHRQVLTALDGSRDRNALVELLTDLVREGMPLVDENGQSVSEPNHVREVLGRAIDAALTRFARGAMLVG